MVAHQQISACRKMNVVSVQSLPSQCRLCGSESLILKGTKAGRHREQLFSFYECARCSFLFVNPVLGPEIYDDAYYRGAGPDPLVDYESEYADYSKTARLYEFNDMLRLAGKHLSRFPSPRTEPIKWLDFGCGAGGLLKFLRDRAFIRVGRVDRRIHASGSDVGSYANRLAAIDGMKIWSEEELKDLPEGNFNVITCIEVVEHLQKPLSTFKLLARSLANNGLLLLSTGNMKSPLAKAAGISFPYCIPEIHVSYFNPGLLRTVYSEIGLTPVRFRFRDSLRFKFLKNISGVLPEKFASRLSNFQPLLRLFDYLYGVSAMPSAAKFGRRETG
jgi:SAM-dependent methyltransferase